MRALHGALLVPNGQELAKCVPRKKNNYLQEKPCDTRYYLRFISAVLILFITWLQQDNSVQFVPKVSEATETDFFSFGARVRVNLYRDDSVVCTSAKEWD